MTIKMGFVEWCEHPEHGFYIRDSYNTETGQPAGPGKLNLFDFQKRILNKVLTPDPETGLFPYTTIVYSCPKKSGKTKIAAAVATWYAECADSGTEVYLIANDQEQAEGLVMKDIIYHAREVGYRALKGEVQLPDGTFIKALSQSYRSIAGTRHGLTIWDELWGYCQSSNTQCYTQNGWKKYSEIHEGDLIATINLNGEWEWKPIQRINVFDFKGEMIRLQHRRASQLMTKDHSVLGRFRSSGHKDFSEMKIMRADEAMKTYEMILPVGADWKGTRGGFTEAQLYLLGMWLAEGSYKTKTRMDKQIVYLAQNKGIKPTKGDIYTTIKHKLEEAGQEYKESGGGFTLYGGLANWIVDNIPTGSFNKFVPKELKELTTQELYWLFIGYMEGDGWISGKGWQVELVSEQMADDFIEIGIKLGYISRYMPNHRTNLRLSFSVGNVRIDRRNWKYEDYDGIVWCPTVENGTWLARNDGFISWTGNCSEAARRAWDEMTPIPTIQQSLRFISTYAGFESQSDLLKELYIKGVAPEEHENGMGHKIEGLEDLPCYANGKLFIYWDHEPRMPWQTQEYYEEQRLALRPSAYIRLHTNNWVTSQEEFIPTDWWDRATKAFTGPADGWLGHPYYKFPVSIGVDAAIKRDCTAIVGCTHDSKRGKTIQLFHKIWTPKAGEWFDLEATVESYLLEQFRKFHVISILCDPAHLHQTLTRLKFRGLPVVEYTQTVNNMVRASQSLYDSLKYNNLESYPDEEMKRHIQLAIAETSSTGFRLVKNKSNANAHMDGSVALALSVYDAIQHAGIDSGEVLTIMSPFSEMGRNRTDPAQFELPFPLRS